MKFEPILKHSPIGRFSDLGLVAAPAMLIEGILPRQGVVVLAAPPFTGKTLLAQAMALAISRGEKFLGKFVSKSGKVVLVEQDSEAIDIKRQVTKLMGIAPAPFDPEADEEETGPFRPVFVKIPWLASDKNVEELAFWINQERASNGWQEMEDGTMQEVFAPGVSLIILDSLSALHSEDDENNNARMHRVLHRVQKLSELCTCCVLLLHHVNKSHYSDRGVPIKMTLDSLRGASAIAAVASTIIGMDRKERTSNTITLLMLKNRPASEQLDIEYYVTYGEQIGDDPTMHRVLLSCESTTPGTNGFRRRIILDLLNKQQWITTEEAVAALMDSEDTKDIERYASFSQIVLRIVKGLESEGAVKREHGKFTLNGKKV